MDAQIFFQDLLAVVNLLQPLACCRDRAIIAAKIDKRLFAFKDSSRSSLVPVGPVSSNIGAMAAPGQTHFQRAGGVTARLRPNRRKPFQTGVRLSFALAI